MDAPTTEMASSDPSKAIEGLFTVASGGPSPEFDVVFVHGLEGHFRNTWSQEDSQPRPRRKRSRLLGRHRASRGTTSNSTKCFWPKDLLAEDFPRARIFTFGYNSAITRFFHESAYHGSILEYCKSLLQRLSAERKDCLRRPLIFIAHSLGGLVVKSALRESQQALGATASWAHISESTIAVLFFGTPHRGSDWTNTAKGLERMVSVLGTSTTTKNLNALTKNNDLARILMDDFLRQLELGRFQVTSYQEQKGCVGFKKLDALIVDNDSSQIGHPKFEKSLPINADHREMCKFGFAGETRETYDQYVKHEISEHLKRASVIQPHENTLVKIFSGTSKQLSGLGEDTSENEKTLTAFRLELDTFGRTMNVRLHQIDDAHEETFSWLLGAGSPGPGLRSWLSTEEGIYWIQGSPGSGKSTAIKSLVQSQRIAPQVNRLLGASGWSHASIFPTDRMDQDKRSFKTVLAAMIYWLWRDNSALSSTIEPLVVREGTISNLWCEDSLKDVLMNCKNQTEVSFSICFFIDAFDEIESDAASRDGMIRFMKDLVSDSVQGHGRFKMCIASRPENEIAIHFRHFRGFCLQDWTADDIRKFVHARLDAHPNARATHRSSSYDETLQRICGDIIGAAQGVFLWVRVVVDHVLSSQTGGESLSEIRQRILDLRNENLSQYFVRILEKTPKETRELTNALFQMLLTSQEPPSILTIGVLLDIVKRRQEPQERHLITEERLLEISTASDISSRISNLTGGLVQVISNDSGHPEATRLPGSNGREVSSSHDRVRFLHASVKDFLRTPEAKSLLESNAFLSSTRKTGPMYNGNVLNLCVADAYLGLDPDHRRSSGWALDAMEITMHHAPAIEASFDDSSLELLLRIFRDLSRQHECTWDMGMPAWNTTFLAFAVAHRMHKFVRKCLNERGFKVRKEGRPLLHYAAWAPGCYPDVTMARILVNAGTSLNKRFKEPAHHGAKTALETLNFKEMEQDGQSHVDFIKFFIEEGAEVTRPIPCGDGPMLVGWFQRAPGIPRHIQRPPWSTVLHIIAEGPIRGAQKMEILKQIPHSRLNDKRADGFTVFGLVLKSGMSGPTSITIEEAGELISLGALITRRIVDMGPPTRELVEQHSRFRYGAWRRRKSLMKDGQLGE